MIQHQEKREDKSEQQKAKISRNITECYHSNTKSKLTTVPNRGKFHEMPRNSTLYNSCYSNKLESATTEKESD